MFSTQPAQDPSSQDPGFPRPGIGGNAFGFVAGIATPVTSHVDVGVDLSLPARFDAMQTTGGVGPTEIENQHRDVIVSPLLRVHQQVARAVRFEEVVGGAFVWESTVQQTAFSRVAGQPGPYGPFFSSPEIDALTMGAVGGANLAIDVGRRIAIVPEARLYWIARVGADSPDVANARLSLDPWVVRLALAARLRF